MRSKWRPTRPPDTVQRNSIPGGYCQGPQNRSETLFATGPHVKLRTFNDVPFDVPCLYAKAIKYCNWGSSSNRLEKLYQWYSKLCSGRRISSCFDDSTSTQDNKRPVRGIGIP